MQFTTRHITASTLTALGLIATMVACSDQPTAVGGMRPTARPSRAVAVAERARYTPPQDPATGEYLLDRVCDVFIGEQVIVAPDPIPEKYAHQVFIDVPAGSKIKLVGTAEMQAAGSKKFTCDATDRNADGSPNLDANGQPQAVIEPTTLHPARGDGPQINTDRIDFDLNGYSIESLPSAADLTGDPLFANISFLITGANVTLRNASAEKSLISRFGHSIDAQGASTQILGKLVGDVVTGDYNLETTGGVALRNHSGIALIDGVKSVDPAVDGQGILVRRCAAGSKSTIRNSHFVGGAEGVFIRECSGVTFDNNYFSSNGQGDGLSTRQAISTTAAPIVITNNTVASNLLSGIIWGRDSRNNSGSLKISGNKVSTWGECGIRLATKNTTIAPLTVTSVTAGNTFLSAGTKVCQQGD
jgi:hypothetical protein